MLTPHRHHKVIAVLAALVYAALRTGRVLQAQQCAAAAVVCDTKMESRFADMVAVRVVTLKVGATGLARPSD